jgi:hypothetical protein
MSTEVFKPAGNQFKRKRPGKHEERLVGRLETVTTVPHEDLILCEAVIVFEACAPPAQLPRLPEACLRAGQRGSDWIGQNNDPERRNEKAC